MSGSTFKKGDRYRVQTPFSAHVLTMWRAPFTGGEAKTLPKGLEFVIDIDPPESATAVAALPDPYAEWERKLVSQTDLHNEKYNGYYLVISYSLLTTNCICLDA